MSIVKLKQQFKSLPPEEKLVIVFSGIGALFAQLMAPVFFFAGKSVDGIILVSLSIFFLVPIILQIYRRESGVSSRILLILASVIIIGMARFDNGLEDEVFYWLSVLPLAGALLQNAKESSLVPVYR